MEVGSDDSEIPKWRRSKGPGKESIGGSGEYTLVGGRKGDGNSKNPAKESVGTSGEFNLTRSPRGGVGGVGGGAYSRAPTWAKCIRKWEFIR